jgi:hypothetical protein
MVCTKTAISNRSQAVINQETNMVVVCWDIGDAILQPKFDFADDGSNHGPKLQICELSKV